MRRFMSGRGGYGLMFRDLGYDPDPALDDAGFINLICGRPYVNLCREPKLFFRDFPYGYDFDAIRADPSKAIYPQLTTVRARMTGRFWWRLPWIVRSMLVSSSRTQSQLKSEAARLEREVYPQFVAAVREARADTQLSGLSNEDLLAFLQRWIERTLNDFARHSLRAGVLAATALAALEQQLMLAKVEDPAGAARHLVMGVRPSADSDLAGAVAKLVAGELIEADFLTGFGHRGPREMELAEPRWSETPERLPHRTKTHAFHPAANITLQEFTTPTPALQTTLDQARSYLALRESSKHYLMLGYALIRDVIVEVGRRTKLQDRVFYLELDELPQALAEVEQKKELSGGAASRQKSGETLAIAIATLAADRMQQRKLLLSLPVPPVIFSEDLEAIGRPPVHSGTRAWQGTALSFGVCDGPALVLTEPIPADDIAEGFVLVCPSTDPAWVPLFMKAGGLVMETGGVLSHGAIVAREFGIPAVAGISDATSEIQTGQRVSVDGTTGRVSVAE